MKNLITIICVLLCFYNQLLGQTQIIDKNTKEPISYAHLISENGIILGMSDLRGFINYDSINDEFDISRDGIIEISHVSFKKTQITFEKLIKCEIIELEENKISLDEVTVITKKSHPDYLVLKGYFRSYQLDDNVPKAYMDGIVEYYISINNNKKLKFNLLKNRTFRNPELYKKLKSKGLISLSTGDRTGPPYIEKRTILNELSNIKLSELTENSKKILTKNDTIGILYFNTVSHFADINVDVISSKNEYTRSIFNHKVRFANFSVTERYLHKDSLWNKKSNLLLRTEYKKQFISHKKKKIHPIQVESFHEFYVFEKRYISKREFKEKETSSFFGPKKTSYSTKFWQGLELKGVPKLPEFINNLFDKKLIIY